MDRIIATWWDFIVECKFIVCKSIWKFKQYDGIVSQWPDEFILFLSHAYWLAIVLIFHFYFNK